MKGQSRRHSFIEAMTNISVGFFIAWMATMYVMPAFGYDINYTKAFGITMVFTVISIVRQYILRRVFNHWMVHKHFQSNESSGLDDVSRELHELISYPTDK